MPTYQPPASVQAGGTAGSAQDSAAPAWGRPPGWLHAQADTVFMSIYPVRPCACLVSIHPSIHSFLLLTQSMPVTLLGSKQGSKG